MVFSMRIVNSDFYIAAPIPDLDVCNSTFRETAISKVPIIRIYGATPSGQKTCLHVHGVFPYIYVPYDGTQPSDKYMKQLAVSVDFAVQVSLGKASSTRQHVYEISLVKGIPFYGYHEGERDFLKISLYNPFLVTRVVSLLQNGAVMNKVFQPHEAHIPYLLQFLMDYNLYGMNLLHASAAKFRNPVRLVDGDGEAIMVKSLAETQRVKSPVTFCGTPNQMWNEDTVPREWILGPEVERVSFCELEVDVLASDILNKREIGVNLGTNPGLAAIWEDEQQRRRDANESSQISGPSSQDRGLIQETETERNLKERIKEIIDERDLLIQSQMGKLGREALSPQELASFQDSICSLAAASQKALAADDDSLDADVMSQLLSQHVQGTLGEGAAAQSSQVIVDEDEPVVNQSIVQEVVEASQMSVSPELSSTMDKEMVNILASLAEEPTQPGSQRTASQSIILDTGDSLSDEEAKDDEDLSEAEESIVMSQRVWDDIEHHSLGSGEEQVADEQGNGEASQSLRFRGQEVAQVSQKYAMPPKRQQVWKDLHEKMANKRTRNEAGSSKKGSTTAPHEIIVQRLSSEPDNKQTYRPVQPREFVNFGEYSDLTLVNLKKACADHFNVPTGSVDVLVSNKGPSATNINQIPHRKDKVYLVRFAVHGQENEFSDVLSYSQSCGSSFKKSSSLPNCNKGHTPTAHPVFAETEYPKSISISELMQAGKLVRPKAKQKTTLSLEKFDVKTGDWSVVTTLELLVDMEKFSSGGFRDAFLATSSNPNDSQKWVIKKYNAKAKDAIEATLKTTEEGHTRKQVQMHAVARKLTKQFSSNAPKQFGQCFQYNHVFFTQFNEPATIEEFVPGDFIKYINNNGGCCGLARDNNAEQKELCIKAECLVHYTYDLTDHKLMLLDIQGSGYQLYDPEIAT